MVRHTLKILQHLQHLWSLFNFEGIYYAKKRHTWSFQKKAITLCVNEIYLVSRNRKKKHPADGSTTEITQESCRENIRRIFIEIIDNIVESLEKKIIAPVKVSTKFKLLKDYSEDLEVQFSYLLHGKYSGTCIFLLCWLTLYSHHYLIVFFSFDCCNDDFASVGVLKMVLEYFNIDAQFLLLAYGPITPKFCPAWKRLKIPPSRFSVLTTSVLGKKDLQKLSNKEIHFTFDNLITLNTNLWSLLHCQTL